MDALLMLLASLYILRLVESLPQAPKPFEPGIALIFLTILKSADSSI